MQRNQGFTLIELIISISIISMLMFTGAYVYSTMSSRWDKELGQFDTNFGQARALNLLHKAISAISPFVVIQTKNDDSQPVLFFVGQADSLLAVSHHGIVNQVVPEIFRLSSVRNTSGSYDLVYQSKSTADILLLTSEQEINFDRSFILLRDLEQIKFEYLGWQNLSKKTQAQYEDTIASPEWSQRFSGLDRGLHPEEVSLTLIKAGKPLQLNIELDVNAEKILQYYLNSIDAG